jgi:hypothetical protein
MNPLHMDAPLPRDARALSAPQARAGSADGRGNDDLAWQRALEQASGLDYGTWFKPVTVPAPELRPAAAVDEAPVQRVQGAAAAAIARDLNSAEPLATLRPSPAHARQDGLDIPEAQRAALAADVAMVLAGFAASAPGVTAADTVASTSNNAPAVATPLLPGAAAPGLAVQHPAASAPAEAAAPAQPSTPLARAAGEQEPLRVHAQWSVDGVSVWLGFDADALPVLDDFIAQLQRTLAARGERLARVVCNGREAWQAVPPSGLSPSFLPADRRMPLPFNRPYEAP